MQTIAVQKRTLGIFTSFLLVSAIPLLAADLKKTVLISSHILTELAEMCDTVAIIEQGRLLAALAEV